jgi:hypothetical protein
VTEIRRGGRSFAPLRHLPLQLSTRSPPASRFGRRERDAFSAPRRGRVRLPALKSSVKRDPPATGTRRPSNVDPSTRCPRPLPPRSQIGRVRSLSHARIVRIATPRGPPPRIELKAPLVRPSVSRPPIVGNPLDLHRCPWSRKVRPTPRKVQLDDTSKAPTRAPSHRHGEVRRRVAIVVEESHLFGAPP